VAGEAHALLQRPDEGGAGGPEQRRLTTTTTTTTNIPMRITLPREHKTNKSMSLTLGNKDVTL